MQKILLSLIFFLSLSTLFGQTYNVIHVKGDIKIKKTGELLKVGDQIQASEAIVFANNQAMAAVISSVNGRLVLKVDKDQVGSELMTIVKKNLFSYAGRLSTRGANDAEKISSDKLTSLKELQTHFRTKKYLILGKELKVEIDSVNFPMTDSTFFFLRYDYKNELIPKRLTHSGNYLILNRDEILKVDEKVIFEHEASDFELFYLKVKSKETTKISNFDPVFPNEKELITALGVILETLNESSSLEIIDEVKLYLNDYYGNTNPNNLSEWLKTTFNVE